MDEVFIDANIFLEIFLKDEKSDKCKAFLRLLQEKNELPVTSDFIIYTCVIQVQNYLKSAEYLKNVIIFFNNYPIKLLRPSFDDFYSAIEIMEISKLDFDDSLVVACMRKYGIKKLASLDKHFDKIKDIERVKFY